MAAAAKSNPSRRSPAIAEVLGAQGAKTAPSATSTVRLIGDRRIVFASGASADERIGAIAERQHGRANREQLLAAGIHPSAITRRLQNRRLDRLHIGVYGLPQTARVPLAPEAAALLACGEGAVLSHHSAATLWGLRAGVARPVHVTVPGGRGCPQPKGVKVHRSLTLDPADICVHEGLPVTSPARTLLDVAATLPDRDVEEHHDEGLFARRILTLAQVRRVLAAAGGHPGRARLARVAGNYTPSAKTDSPPEKRLLELIRASGLPPPQGQVDMLGYRLDFYWAALRLAVEVDAYGTHGARPRFEADRRRDARLLAEKGIVVVRVTKAAIEQRPLEVVAALARAIGQREAELRRYDPRVRGRW